MESLEPQMVKNLEKLKEMEPSGIREESESVVPQVEPTQLHTNTSLKSDSSNIFKILFYNCYFVFMLNPFSLEKEALARVSAIEKHITQLRL